MSPMWEWMRKDQGGSAPGTTANAGVDLQDGQLVRISGDNLVAPADNSALATSFAIGAAQSAVSAGQPVRISTDGAAQVLFDPGLVLAAGNSIYLSKNGRATNVPPTTPGESLLVVGELLDSSVYNPAAPDPFATVVLDIEEPTPRT